MAFAAFFDCKCTRDSHQFRMVTDPSDLLSAVPCAYALWAGTVRGLLQLWDETETFSRCQRWIRYFKLVERDSLSLLGALSIGDADFITFVAILQNIFSISKFCGSTLSVHVFRALAGLRLRCLWRFFRVFSKIEAEAQSTLSPRLHTKLSWCGVRRVN